VTRPDQHLNVEDYEHAMDLLWRSLESSHDWRRVRQARTEQSGRNLEPGTPAGAGTSSTKVAS
jgi:hypothetical protein